MPMNSVNLSLNLNPNPNFTQSQNGSVKMYVNKIEDKVQKHEVKKRHQVSGSSSSLIAPLNSITRNLPTYLST